MFDNVFPKGQKSTGSVPPSTSYDGQPDPAIALRLLQHVSAPSWQTHAFLRFVGQPYWTENILFDVALGVDTPVLVDRQFVMAAQPAIRCMEEVAAASMSDCNPSFARYNSVMRLEGLWRLLEAGREKSGDHVMRSIRLPGVHSISRLYSSMKTIFFLTSSTPGYLSPAFLQRAIDTCYHIVSEHLLVHSAPPFSADEPVSLCPGSPTATDGSPGGRSLYLSGCSTPGLADSVMFAHLVEVASASSEGIQRIRSEFPSLFYYFQHLCREYFHLQGDQDQHRAHGEMLLQSNAALLHSLRGMGGQDGSATRDLALLLFGESPSTVPQYPLGPQGVRPLVPHLNSTSELQCVRLLKKTYSLRLPRVLRQLMRGDEEKEDTDNCTESYIGVRCLLFSNFVVYCVLKSSLDMARVF